ncbi:lysozyme inhibitor LprI family protein [Entomohabitans teleogrylli]|uniref:lysozyme inhibitor LprI family protein n=1 Tax=Entomohabitans teleogrylli TaxID=1384589 RepID=UPI00073D353D|nr:lysozyme inhibitor LprI family protein [Entomohabitans teleogrylli]
MKPVYFLFAGLLFSGTALASECDNAASQTELTTCAAAEYQKADQELNSTYQNALSRASESQRALLKKAQNSWIELRDADCAFLSSASSGGSIQEMVNSQCMADKTRDRNAYLESLMECDEGDLSCPLRGQ